jgi:hypothetical protein
VQDGGRGLAGDLKHLSDDAGGDMLLKSALFRPVSCTPHIKAVTNSGHWHSGRSQYGFILQLLRRVVRLKYN